MQTISAKPWAARVIVNGKDTGIIETNRVWAEEYWLRRAARLRFIVLLVPE